MVAFFEGEEDPCRDILDCFITEKDSDDANYPLIRRYFNQGNAQLKKLIFYGLEKIPWDTRLLRDLAFFYEFKPDLKELIKRYYVACRVAPNPLIFKELAEDFYQFTEPYGYDAFYVLIQDEAISSGKKEIIRELKDFYESPGQVISF